MNKATFTITDDKKTIVMERKFNAAKTKLWQAYSTAEMLSRWFAPQGWDTEVKNFDFKEGGQYQYVMKCVDQSQEWFGQTSAGKMVYGKISPEDSFEYTDYFTDEDGNTNESMPTSRTTVAIADNGDGTANLTVRTAYATEEELKTVLEMGMEEGYAQTLDKLEAVVTE